MIELESLSWWKSGREDRQGVVCKKPEGFPDRGEVDPEVLKCGDRILIDGGQWICRGIEYWLTNPPKLGDSLSLMVEPVGTVDLP